MKTVRGALTWIGIFVLLNAFAPAFAVNTQYTYDELNRLWKVEYDNGVVVE